MRGVFAVTLATVVGVSCLQRHTDEPATWGRRAESEQLRIERGLRGARVVDRESGVGLRFELRSPGVMRVVQSAAGLEDDVGVTDDRTSIEYDLFLEGDTRLRLVAGVLELLDPSGTPRVRVTAREVRDAQGSSHPAHLRLSGCVADNDPRAPWGRPTVLPGSTLCGIEVSWEPGLARPVTVDPGWTAAKGMLTTPRTGHTMTTLADGRVLLTGGVYKFGNFQLDSAELFDPATQTFAATGTMNAARYSATAARLLDGRVLVAGGATAPNITTAQADLYDPNSGKFTATGPLLAARYDAAMLRLSTGNVLIAGGFDNVSFLDDAELYDAGKGSWTSLGAMDVWSGMGNPPARYGVSLAELQNGDVLVSGGTNFADATWAACVLLHPPYYLGKFEPTGAMNHARYFNFALPMPNGNVWVSGGFDPGDYFTTDTVEIYDAQTRTFTNHGKLNTWHALPIVGVLPKGYFVVAGGFSRDATGTIGRNTDVTEIYDPIRDILLRGPMLPQATAFVGGAVLLPSASLPNGGLLSAGGSISSGVLASAVILEIGEGGQICKEGAECSFGRCDHGRCCAAADECTGTCRSCLPTDGTCGPNAKYDDDPETCTGEVTCDGAGACAKKNGRDCTNGSECASGFCTEGTCCESTCNAPCGSCVLDGRKGSCLPVPVGTPPRSTCARFEGCGGRSTSCAHPACATRTESVSVDGQTVGCAPYICGSEGTCLVECKTAADCVEPSVCDHGRCIASRFDVGAAGCGVAGARPSLEWIFPSALFVLLRRRKRYGALLFSALVGLVPRVSSAENWTSVGQLQFARFRTSAVLLQNGNVWVTAGCDDPKPYGHCLYGILSSSEIFDGKSSTLGPDVGKRYSHTTTVLVSGKVLVVGGCTGSSRGVNEGCDATASALVCDVPGSCATVSGGGARGFHTATLLNDGRVLVAGGFDTWGGSLVPALSTTEIYDPNQNTLSPGPLLKNGRGGHAATLLADGRVLLIGGAAQGMVSQFYPTDTTEIFDPTSNLVAANPPVMTAKRISPAAVLLPSGKVLVASGYKDSMTLGDSAELFDPQSGFTASMTSLTNPMEDSHAVFLSGLGRALVFGGFSNTYDPQTGAFGDLSSLAGPVIDYGFVSLGPLGVMLLGGHPNIGVPPTKLVQVFQLRTEGAPCEKSLDCNSRNCIDKVCCAPDCDGRCVACAAGTGSCQPVMRGVEHGACAADRTCDGAGACGTKDGRACATNNDCFGAQCVDGVCCENACTGSCVACDRAPAGKCLPIVGVPALGHPACPQGKACGGASSDCVPSICDGAHTIRVGDKAVDCTPYRCAVTGQCLERCSSIQHCVAPYACTPDGLCDKPAFDRGAGCDESGGSGTWMATFAAMAALALLRSRRARPPSA